MEKDRLTSAVERIERALARIEQAAASQGGGDPDIAQKHERLKGEVKAVLQEMDTLIAKERVSGG